VRYYDSLKSFLISNVCKYKPHTKDAEKVNLSFYIFFLCKKQNDLYLMKWLSELNSTQFMFTQKFTEISLSNIFSNGSEDLNPILKNSLYLNSAYSSFLKFYFSQSNHFTPKTFISHPFYSNYEPLYTTWGVDFIGTVDYIW